MFRAIFLATGLLAIVLSACQQEVPLPKPRGYPKVDYPARGVRSYSDAGCPFAFEYPSYARVVRDTLNAKKAADNPCWFDLYVPAFDCRLYCSYYEIGQGKTLEELTSDAFELADWHTKKANYIDETPISRPPDMRGLVFTMDGPAATPFQFFLTDEKKHFFRGVLYFNTTINPDSLAPLYAFVRKDLDHLVETFTWKE